MFQRTKFAAIAATLLLSLALALSGCGSGKPAAGSPPPATAAPAAAVEYTVKHAMGTTTIKKQPERVVVLVNDGVEDILALGVKPVGMVRAWGIEPYYPHLKNDLQGVQIVGDEQQPNLELITSLKPDLIIGNKIRQEKIYDQLSAIAPTILSERLQADWKINFMLFAEALNKKEEGGKKLAEFDKHLAEVKQKLGDKVNSQVSLARFYVGDKVRIYYNDTFAGNILKTVGLKRPAVQNKDTFADIIPKERIPELEGDVLFYFTLEDDKGETTKNEKAWQEEALWKNLNVVKAGNVHKVDDGIWNSSGGIISANLMLDDLVKYLVK